MSVIHITSTEQFKQEVLSYQGIVVVDFWAEWCGPCRMLSPIMDELAHDMNSSIKVIKVNVEENPELTSTFQVSSIPTVFFIKNGQIVDTLIGVNPKQVYQDKINELLNNSK